MQVWLGMWWGRREPYINPDCLKSLKIWGKISLKSFLEWCQNCSSFYYAMHALGWLHHLLQSQSIHFWYRGKEVVVEHIGKVTVLPYSVVTGWLCWLCSQSNWILILASLFTKFIAIDNLINFSQPSLRFPFSKLGIITPTTGLPSVVDRV